MKQVMLKITLTSSLLAASAVSFAATQATTNFQALVNNSCSLTNGNNGVLTLDPTGTYLSTELATGSRGAVLLACNGTGALSISNYTQTGAGTSPITYSIYLYNSVGSPVIANNNGSIGTYQVNNPTGAYSLNVTLNSADNSPLASGDYSGYVVTTVTSN